VVRNALMYRCRRSPVTWSARPRGSTAAPSRLGSATGSQSAHAAHRHPAGRLRRADRRPRPDHRPRLPARSAAGSLESRRSGAHVQSARAPGPSTRWSWWTRRERRPAANRKLLAKLRRPCARPKGHAVPTMRTPADDRAIRPQPNELDEVYTPSTGTLSFGPPRHRHSCRRRHWAEMGQPPQPESGPDLTST
jgi:hypothetical protein